MDDKIQFNVKGYMDITVTMSSIELFEKLVRSLHCNALLEDDFCRKYWYDVHENETALKHIGSDEIYDDRGDLYLLLQDLGCQIIPNWENRGPVKWVPNSEKQKVNVTSSIGHIQRYDMEHDMLVDEPCLCLDFDTNPFE